MRGFVQALEAKLADERLALIAEIKKASPSQGLIRGRLRSAGAGPRLCRGRRRLPVGADRARALPGRRRAISRRRARRSPCPACARTSSSSPYQVVETRALGADCMLLIMAALERSRGGRTGELRQACCSSMFWSRCTMPPSSTRALRLAARLIGINNRNLKTLRGRSSHHGGAGAAGAAGSPRGRRERARLPRRPAAHGGRRRALLPGRRVADARSPTCGRRPRRCSGVEVAA